MDGRTRPPRTGDRRSPCVDDRTRLLLVDPTDPPGPVAELGRRSRGGDRADLCMAPARTRKLLERFGATLHMPPPDRATPLPGTGVSGRDRLPIGVEIFPGWSRTTRAVVQRQRALVGRHADQGNRVEFPADWAASKASARADPETLRRCSTCRWSWCCRRTAHPPIGPRYARSPEAQAGALVDPVG